VAAGHSERRHGRGGEPGRPAGGGRDHEQR
jgi:hypothetical protein